MSHRVKGALAVVAASAIASGAMVAVQSAPASATTGYYCGYYGNGYTGGVTKWTKPKDSCNDLNLTWVKWSGRYGGKYWNNGAWVLGSSGFHYHGAKKHWDQILLTNVRVGTRMYVARSDGQAGFNVHINY